MSTVAEHVMDIGYDIDWNGTQVLDSCSLLGQRLLLESWYVQCEQHSLNRKHGLLPSIYCTLIGDTMMDFLSFYSYVTCSCVFYLRICSPFISV